MDKMQPLPRVVPVQPKVLEAWHRLGNMEAWDMEPKYDGFRGLFYKDSNACWFMGKDQQRLEDRFDPLCQELSSLCKGDRLILDGEIVALDENGLPVRDKIRNRWARLHYAPFDCLWQGDTDRRLLPLAKRRELLAALLPKDSAIVIRVPYTPWGDTGFLRKVVELGLEGIVLKRRQSAYRRRTEWYKLKSEEYAKAG